MNIHTCIADDACIHEAVAILKAGGVVAIPTETVYGLAADATNSEAVAKIFSLKGRPTNHPLIVHIAPPLDMDSDDAWIEILLPWVREIPMECIWLAKAFWPGPLTMVLPKAKGVLDAVTGGQLTVAIRCPKHPAAIALLREFGTGLAAPSANRFGRISPTSAEHVKAEFISIESLDRLLVLDGGASQVGIESTIVDMTDFTSKGIQILRPGMVTAAQIQGVTGVVTQLTERSKIRVSGGLSAHYAPFTPLRIVTSMEKNPSKRVAVLSTNLETNLEKAYFHIPNQPEAAAREIYHLLRMVDSMGFEEILVEALPQDEIWSGINDRLKRAEVGSGT